jgi:hypothetical protein
MITQQELKELLNYDPDAGIFTWRNSRYGVTKNMNAGTLMYLGYIKIEINKKAYLAHRLVWLYVYGYFPKYVDHVNLIKNDNRLINLREATQSENNCNRKITKNNTSGIKGVSWFKRDKNWRARIQFNGKNIHLGYFKNIEEAKFVIENYRKKFHGKFAHNG